MHTNPVSIITRAALAGAAAGLLAALFFLTVSQSTLDEAIAFEEQASRQQDSETVGDSSVDTEEEPLVSRETQTIGAVVASLLYGALTGVVFGTVFAAVRHRLPSETDFGRASQLALMGFFATAVIPAIKYPANPPGVGNPDDVNQRTIVFVTLLGASIAVVTGLVVLYRWLKTRFDRPTAQVLVAAASVISFVAVLVLWPADTTVVPEDFPADLLWRFRIQALTTLLITWGGLGLFTGWLLSRGGKLLDLRQ